MKTLLSGAVLIFVVAFAGLGVRGGKRSDDEGRWQTVPTQPSTRSPQEASSPQAKPGDVDTLEHILAAVYDCISGPAGPRDWNRFRSLFYSGARLISTRRDPSGNASPKMLSVDDYVRGAQAYFDKEGFYEAPVANRVEQWDHIAHVWSTYESRRAKGEKPFARGINSFQFFYDGSRWWVVTIYWEGEEAGHPLPEKYLK
jgi:hypothetical protein